MTEITYALNVQATLEQGCLVIDLLEANKSEVHPVAYWRSLARHPHDQEILAFFWKEELNFQQRTTGRSSPLESLKLKQVHISPMQVSAAFKLLAVTQKLYCKGKQLVVDLFNPATFYYEAANLSSGSLEIKGRLRWGQHDLDLRDCDAIGPGKPNWFVHHFSLKMIQPSISWKTLRELRQASLLLEGTAKQAFLEDLDPKDPDTPQLVFKQGSLEEAIQSTTPYPILILKDRWGAFADLWMDYGHGIKIAFHDTNSPFKQTPLKRQREVELSWEKDLLETDFIKKQEQTSHYYCPMDRIAKSLAFLLEVGWQIQDWQGRQVIKHTGFTLNLEERPQAIAIKGHLQYETHEADMSQVLGVFNRREHFIQLSPQTVGLLPTDATQQALQDLAEESEWVGQETLLKKSRFGALDSLWAQASPSPSLTALHTKWQNFSGIQEALPSAAFHGQLRPYQQQGVNWLAFLQEYGFHGILADEMGLGKTVQILAFLSRLPPDRPHLIVLPTSLLFNWRQEIQHFLPSFRCLVYQGSKRSLNLQDLQQVHIILTSYTVLRLDILLLQKIEYGCVILDEAQMIKNAQTQTAQAACQLSAQLRLCLTGTPVENHLQELWSHFRFLMPDLLGSQEEFDAQIQAAQVDRRYLDRLKKKVTPFLLRRRKQEVAKDLPPRIDQTMWIEMQEDQRAFYEHVLAGFKSGLLKKVALEGARSHRLEILEALLRLRQICCHPLLVSSLLEDTPLPSSAKFDALLQDLETLVAEKHKVLVYSQFTSMLKLIAKAIKERGWSYGYLDGSTENREEVVTRFQEDPTQYVFLLSLKAGGVGLNLTAADYVYLYDPWWNEAVEEQAINRAHRIGRHQHVIAKRFVMAESIEERMMKLKATKRLLIEDIFDSEAISSQLSLEDLQELFS